MNQPTATGTETKEPFKHGAMSVLKFGKYRGDTISEVLEKDHAYLRWCIENINWFKVTANVLHLLEDKE